ncbi:unnamed protein product [Lupinus luteus]|uniref:Uncharacterized protein n=1 Tax=Lupinus luteus TaxID=3873 RepID=A0AAV1VW38_LUPLU
MRMEDQDVLAVNIGREEEEDEFCCCCEDEEYEEVWKESNEPVVEVLKDEYLVEFSVKMFFKGLSIARVENSSSGFSGIGVFMERSTDLPAIRVHKKLDFYAEDHVGHYLDLLGCCMIRLAIYVYVKIFFPLMNFI